MHIFYKSNVLFKSQVVVIGFSYVHQIVVHFAQVPSFHHTFFLLSPTFTLMSHLGFRSFNIINI